MGTLFSLVEIFLDPIGIISGIIVVGITMWIFSRLPWKRWEKERRYDISSRS